MVLPNFGVGGCWFAYKSALFVSQTTMNFLQQADPNHTDFDCCYVETKSASFGCRATVILNRIYTPTMISLFLRKPQNRRGYTNFI